MADRGDFRDQAAGQRLAHGAVELGQGGVGLDEREGADRIALMDERQRRADEAAAAVTPSRLACTQAPDLFWISAYGM